MINGVTDLALTKADVLSMFEQVQMAVSYKYEGIETDELPYDLDRTDIECVYRACDGWMEDVSGISDYNSLPAELKGFIETIETELNTPVTIVSTGPERESLLTREAMLTA